MGYDGVLYDLDYEKTFNLTCYKCSKEINLKEPRLHHENCTYERNGVECLKVIFNLPDYESR